MKEADYWSVHTSWTAEWNHQRKKGETEREDYVHKSRLHEKRKEKKEKEKEKEKKKRKKEKEKKERKTMRAGRVDFCVRVHVCCYVLCYGPKKEERNWSPLS